MINFIRNDFYRISTRKYYILISVLMTMISIVLGVYLTSNLQTKANIAIVSKSTTSSFQSKYANVTLLDKEPEKYELVLSKYDGVIIDKGNGKYAVDTIKNEDYRKTLEMVLKNPKDFKPENKDSRGIGTTIIGYLLMFILLQGVLFMFTLAEDIELKQIERIASAPISFIKYLLSNFIFNFFIVFLPAFLILAVMKDIFGYNIGFSLVEYAGLLGIIVSFGIAFAMFINSIVKVSDIANMMGSSIVVLTTILAGSFYSFENGNKILEKAIWILPQKDFLSFVQGLENGKNIITIIPQLSYVIVISLVFFIFSIIKIKKDYVLRKD
mgnify:CR=1 FL=1